MISQQKALDLSFNLAPWEWLWHYHEAAMSSCPKRSQKPSAPTYARRRGALLTMPGPFKGAKSGRDIIRRLPRPFATKIIFCWIFGGFLTSCLLWDTIFELQSFSRCQIKAEIKGFFAEVSFVLDTFFQISLLQPVHIPSTLNIELIPWHTKLIVWSVK